MMKKSFLILVILVLTFSLCASNCSAIENDIFGSDHCPVTIELDI